MTTTRVTIAGLCLVLAGVSLLPSGSAVAATVLGYNATALLKSDLTDPDNNIADNVPANPPYYGTGYNWVSASASSENWFSPGNGGSEASLDLFDNKVGGGEAKYCCNGGTQWVALEMPKQYILSKFTITSDNDSGTGRDPDVWQIQGSNDGVAYTNIFSYNSDGNSPFNLGGGSVENKVIRYDGGGVDFATPAPYKYFRFYATSYGASNVLGLGELEYFGTTAPALTATPASGSVLDYGLVNGQTGAAQQFTLANTGTLGSTIDILTASITGPDAALFALPSDPTLAALLIGGQAGTTFDVNFLGTLLDGPYSATLTLTWQDRDSETFQTPFTGSVSFALSATVVPEPATLALAGLAATGLAGYLRRRRTA